MYSRKWTVKIVICALVACAAARPGDTAPSSNEIRNSEEHTKAEDATTATKTALVEASTEAGRDGDRDITAHSKPVNEQYPHALLFGRTCGGTIISPKWVLTAAHCTISASVYYLFVTAGTNNSRDSSSVERRVKRLVIHPRFSVGPYWLDAEEFGINQVAASWDFLLAELEEPLPLDGKTIAAVELDDGPSIPDGLEVGFAGYGTATHGGYMQHVMHSRELRVLSDSKCKDDLLQYDAENMVCTQGRPPRYDTACSGDSGSGLVANGKLYGVLSWGQDDALSCKNRAYVIFSRVSAVRDWIRQVTGV